MTPEERAKFICREYLLRWSSDEIKVPIDKISEQIHQAIQEEREACAQLILARGNFKGVYTAIDPKLTAEAIRSLK